MKTFLHFLKAGSSILALTTNLLIGLSQPNLLILGACVALGLVSLFGLQSSRQLVFATPFLASAIIIVASIFTSPLRGVTMQILLSLQLLLLIFTTVIGSSAISFERIINNTNGPIEPDAISSENRALRTHIVSLTRLATASFSISSVFLLLGNAASFRLEPLLLVAAAIAILLLSLVFLGTNPSSESKPKEKA